MCQKPKLWQINFSSFFSSSAGTSVYTKRLHQKLLTFHKLLLKPDMLFPCQHHLLIVDIYLNSHCGTTKRIQDSHYNYHKHYHHSVVIIIIHYHFTVTIITAAIVIIIIIKSTWSLGTSVNQPQSILSLLLIRHIIKFWHHFQQQGYINACDYGYN